jgi:hypothetical protein
MGISSSSQKTNSISTGATTATYGYQTPPTTPAVTKLAGAKFEVDPGLHAQYGKLRSKLKSGFNNPLGANYSPEVRDAIIRSGEERLGRDEAEAYRGGQYDANRLGYSRDVTVAGMSQPQLVQTGGTTSGTSSGTVQQNPAWGPGVLSAATGIAPVFSP